MSPEFDLAQWAVNAAMTAGVLTPFVMALTKGSEKFGLSGKSQLAFAGVVGLLLGAFAQIALYDVPDSILEWFLLALFAILMAGVPVGTYESIKHAAKKASE
jgi:FtsH-binding integral membrane protein